MASGSVRVDGEFFVEATNDEMMAEVATYIQQHLSFDPDIEIEPDDEIISSGLMDSFSLVELRGWIEKRYGVFLPDHRVTAASFSTVRKMIPIIQEHLAAAAK
jgi:acyl carrier protein